MFITLILVCAAFGLFIILNWKYISDPDIQFRNVISEAIFANGRDAEARMKQWGFYHPWGVVCFLVYLQGVMAIHLLIKKHLALSRLQWLFLIGTLAFYMFIPRLWEYFDIMEDSDFFVPDIVTGGTVIFTLFLFFASLILFFQRKFSSYRKFFAISFFTVMLNLVFIYSFFELFFD